MKSGQELADEGMTRAFHAATEAFKREALWAIYDVAYDHNEFTTDLVWNLLDERGFNTTERRALGQLMKRAIAKKIVKRSFRYQPSTRPEAHANPKPIYLSLVFNEEPRRSRKEIV